MNIALTFVLYTSLLILIPVFNNKAAKANSKKTAIIYILVASFVCATISALRGTTGADSKMYIDAYTNGVNSVSRWVDFEIGFRILIKILNAVGLSYQSMFFIMEFIPSVCCFMAIYDERDKINVTLATFIYMTDLYFFGFNGMRQMFAIGVSIYAMMLYMKNKKIKSIILICIAGVFHKSAFMCFAIVFAKKLFTSKRRSFYMIVSIGAVALLVANRNLLGSIITFLTGSSYYGGYVTRNAYVDTSILNYYIKLLPILILPFAMYTKIKNDKEIFAYTIIMIIGFILSSLGAVTATQVSRLGMYFSMLKIFVCGFCSTQSIPVKIGRTINSKELVKYLLFLYFTFFFYYNYFIRGFSEIVPFGKAL